MLSCLLLVLGTGSVLGGVSIQMPYQHPAGVTYSHLPAAIPAVPSHLQYVGGTTSSVAYGNPFFARSLAAAPVAHIPAPIARIAAPVVPTVHHLPAIAQVPVTRYEAQPAVIQNLVDVAKPKLATRKIEIRRPAIQKEFYDVEERVIIRPAGSAVVELDQPVSKSQKGPTIVQPALHTVVAAPAIPALSVRTHPIHHHVALPGPSVALYPHPHPVEGASFFPPHISTTPLPSLISEPQPTESPQQLEEFPQQISQENTQQIPQQGFELIPQQNPQQIPQQDSQPIPQQDPQQFEDPESISVENPEIARARFQPPQLQQARGQLQPQNIPPRMILQAQFASQQNQLLARFQGPQQANMQQQMMARSQVQAQERIVASLQEQTQAQQNQLQRSQLTLQHQQQELERSQQALETLESLGRSQTQQQPIQPQTQYNEAEGLPSVGSDFQRQSKEVDFQARNLPGPERQSQEPQEIQKPPQGVNARVFNIDAADLRSALTNGISRLSPATQEIPSVRISPQHSLSNQERLISLLTAGGGVAEVLGPLEPSHKVRARVLSVTPAPEGTSPHEEKINTRRIIVNRPIQTVEQVDVVEPFTKIEKVAVHSPALIKTARLDVAHLPTSLPVHGYAHAIPAY